MPLRQNTLLQSQTFILSLCDRTLINFYRKRMKIVRESGETIRNEKKTNKIPGMTTCLYLLNF